MDLVLQNTQFVKNILRFNVTNCTLYLRPFANKKEIYFRIVQQIAMVKYNMVRIFRKESPDWSNLKRPINLTL